VSRADARGAQKIMPVKNSAASSYKRSNGPVNTARQKRKDSHRAARESNRAHARNGDGLQASAPQRIRSLAERVQIERERMFKALSLVLCCKYATVTKWQVDDQEYMIPAFQAICDLLDDAAEELELIAKDCEVASSRRPRHSTARSAVRHG
jgi:hypothetical protein